MAPGKHAPRSIAAAACLAALGLAPLPAAAWEEDVHFGLTKWLALKAGFTGPQAQWIAQGDQDVDESTTTGPVLGSVMSACLGADDPGAVTVQHNHFPSRVTPPAAAASRAVQAADIWSDRVRRPPPSLEDGDESSHRSLGRYLHAFQDSWSHQGVPDVPPYCKPDLGWGHALARGGWSCHLADLTYRWVEADVLPMAKATFDTLLAARNGPRKGKNNGKAASGKDWPALAAQVRTFAEQKTKEGKEAWFRGQGFEEPARFLLSSSLPACENGAKGCRFNGMDETLVDRWRQRLATTPLLPPNLPAELRKLFTRLLDAMAKGAKEEALELIDHKLAQMALERALGMDPGCKPAYDAFLNSTFGKGFLDGRGAGQPLAVCELATALTHRQAAGLSCAQATQAFETALKNPGQAPAKGPPLPDLVRKFAIPPYLFTVAPRLVDGEAWAFARFAHLPAEQLAIGARMVNGRFTITALLWAPEDETALPKPPTRLTRN